MAERRMFSKKVINSDAFIDMPATARAFYYHLSMMADDDGFVNNTRSTMRSVSSTEEDIQILINKGFIIYFEEEGVSVIRHWKIANSVRKDLYTETKYKELKARLSNDRDGAYTLQKRNEPVTESLHIGNETGTLDLELDQDQKREREEFTPAQKILSADTSAPEKKDLVTRVEHHRKHWESCGLPPAPIIMNLDELSRIKPVMDSFQAEKIDEAIKNFSSVVSQPNFNSDILPGGHIPNFKNFLIRWVDRFTDEAKPFTVYGQKTKAKPPPGKGPDWGGAVEMGKPVKAKSFFDRGEK